MANGPVYTNDMPAKVDGVRLDTLAYNIETLTGRRMLPNVRNRDVEIPGQHGVMPSIYDDYEPGKIALSMWARSVDTDGTRRAGVNPKIVFFDQIDRIFSLFRTNFRLLDFRQQFGSDPSDRYAAIDNPRLDKSTGVGVVRTNWISDPSFEGLTSPLITRTNLIRNPSFETNTARWTAGVGCTISRVAGGFGGAGSWHLNMTANGVAGNVEIIADSATSAVTPGEVYTASAWVGTQQLNPGVTMNIRIRWMAPDNITTVSETASDQPVSVTATVFPGGTRIEPEFVQVSAEAPAGTGFGKVVIRVEESVGVGRTSGEIYCADAVLLENSPTPGEYFDGSFTSEGASWSGVANDSTSVITEQVLANWGTTAASRIIEDGSTKANGTSSGRWETIGEIPSGQPALWQTGTWPDVVAGTITTAAVAEVRTAATQNDTVLTVPLPRDGGGEPLWTDGQLATVVFNVNDNAETLTPPAGWQVLDTGPVETGSQEIMAAWTFLTADQADPTLTITAVQKIAGVVTTYTGNDGTNPIAGVGVRGTRGASSTSTVAGAVTTTQTNQLVMGFWGEKSSNSTTFTPPAGMTTVGSIFTTGAGEASAAVTSQVVAAAGATGTRTATYNVASATGYGLLVAIRGGVQAGTGTVVSGSVFVRSDMDDPPQLLLKIAGTDAINTFLGYGRLGSPTGPEQAGALIQPGPFWWRYKTESIYLPPGSTKCRLQITADQDIGAGAVVNFDAATLEKAPSTPRYFDGDSGTGYTWQGVADASFSDLKMGTPDSWVAFQCTLVHATDVPSFPVPGSRAYGKVTVSGSFPSIGSVDITPSSQGQRWTAGAWVWGGAGSETAKVAIRQKLAGAVTTTVEGPLTTVTGGWTWVPGPEVLQTDGDSIHMRVFVYGVGGITATNGAESKVGAAILCTGPAANLRYFDELAPGAVAPENLVSGSRVRKPPDDRMAWCKTVDEINPTVTVDAAGHYKATFGIILSIPGTFWQDTLPVVWTSDIQNIAHTRTYEITNLQGATAPLEELIFIVYGGGGSTYPRITDPRSGAYVQLSSILPTGQAWRFDAGRWLSGKGSASLQSTSSSWGDSRKQTTAYSPRARMVLHPQYDDAREDHIVRVQLSGAKQIRVIGRRMFL